MSGKNSLTKIVYWGSIAASLTLTTVAGVACWNILKKDPEPARDGIVHALYEPSEEEYTSRDDFYRAVTYEPEPYDEVVEQEDEVARNNTSEERQGKTVRRQDFVRNKMLSLGELIRRAVELESEAEAALPEIDPDLSENRYDGLKTLLAADNIDYYEIPDPDDIRAEPSHTRGFPETDEDGRNRDRGLRVQGRWVNHEIGGELQSYLYAFVQDSEDKLVTFHQYHCGSRNVSRIISDCRPVASLFVQDGNMVLVGYWRNGDPKFPEMAGPANPESWSSIERFIPQGDVLNVIRDLSLYIDEGL